MRVLVVEDSRRIRESLEAGLHRSGLAVDSACDGEEALHLARINSYDVIVLDLMLPKMDGLTVLSKLRAEKNGAHVLILTARDAVEDRVKGLDAGADDYLPKPFAFDELLARIHALTRRKYDIRQNVIEIADLQVDLAARTVMRAGEEIPLTSREFALLEYLAMRRGHVVSRRDIEESIYDGKVEPASNAVDSGICSLRRKIDPPSGASLIQTRRGLGYVLPTQQELSTIEGVP